MSLPDELSDDLRSLTQREGCTLFMTLLAAFQALLYRYTGEPDINVGIPVAGRTRPEVQDLIGFFLNTLVMRSKIDGAATFRELLQQVKEASVGAQAHQDVPFELIVVHVQPERSLTHSPLFQVMFNLLTSAAQPIALPGLALKPFDARQNGSKFDMTLYVTETDAPIDLILAYNTDLFDASTIGQMLRHFQTLLEGVTTDPEKPLSQIPLVTGPELQQLVLTWNDTQRDFGPPHSIQELFELSVARAPHAVAVTCGSESLTYLELDQRVNQLAFRLRQLGVGPEVIVGVCLGRSMEMVVALLAVLKAGGALLQLDLSYPAERLVFMLEDSQVSLLLTRAHLRERFPHYNGAVLCLDEMEPVTEAECASLPAVITRPEQLAWIFYTSGSTGRPKGVMTTQGAAVNFLRYLVEEYELSGADVVLQMAALSFDASMRDILGPLMAGAAVILLEDEVARDPRTWLETIEEQGVTCLLSVVPTMLNTLTETAIERHWTSDSLRLVLCSGENLLLSDCLRLRSVFGEDLSIVNLYGPTECTMTQSYYRVIKSAPAQGIALAGRPIPNTDFYILDQHYNPVPVGVAGEVFIGGEGLARGYLNSPDLTAHKFIPHPFSVAPGARLYQTGDRARYRRDGNMEVLGRLDQQIKIRGQRVETAEVEETLGESASLQNAVVIAREDRPGEKCLVAYVVASQPQATLNFHELREALRSKLPDYMIPSAFVQMDHLPLTPNGKVDRRALPVPDYAGRELTAGYVAPRGPMEELLAGIWSQLLGVERVSRNDNFFEVGGHSLLATRLVSRVRATLNVDIPLRAVFEYPNISQFASYIERELNSNRDGAPQLVAVARDRDLPLSFAQQRLWFLDQLEPGSPLYNMPSPLRLDGELNHAVLDKAFREIVRRHEVLRTRFEETDGRPIQLVEPSIDLHISLVDFSALTSLQHESLLQHYVTNEAQRGFDLARGPLVRAILLRLNASEHVLLFTMHHIISDAWSMGVLVNEVATLYRAFLKGEPSPLPELAIQYADYAVWQREWLQGEMLERQVEYWRERLADAPAELALPTDHARPLVQSHHGASQTMVLAESLTEQLRELSRREGVTLFMTLLAGWSVLLGRYAGVRDVTIGTPIAGRTRAEIESLIGFFVNTLALRVNWESDWTVVELLRAVREVCLGGFSHQELPFEKLVEELQPERSLGRTPVFQVMLVLQNAPTESLELPGLTMSGIRARDDVAKFELSLSLIESENTLLGGFEYNADLFDATTIKRLSGHFQTLLQAMIAHPEEKLSRLSLLTPAERQQLLADWNNPTPVASNTWIHQLFEAQARRDPEHLAVVFQEEKL
ncbi:MAG TPA: amino acid adenylation domain-containing protein, partial [Pyrinomonadaceae bacterium]|nr:amino acid adenylation domain-containing protein [Pyrinomonadaceae bacterium]